MSLRNALVKAFATAFLLATSACIVDESHIAHLTTGKVTQLSVDEALLIRDSVTADMISSYNQAANQVKLKHLNQYVRNEMKRLNRKGNFSHSHVTGIAKTLGLASADDVIQMMSQPTMSEANLNRIAKAQGLDPEILRVFLIERFGIQQE